MILSGPIPQILHPRTCITCFLVKWSGTCHCHSFTNGKCVNMWGSPHFSIRKPGMLYFGLACVKTKRQTERFSSDLIPKYQQWLGIPLALKWGARTQNPGLLCEWQESAWAASWTPAVKDTGSLQQVHVLVLHLLLVFHTSCPLGHRNKSHDFSLCDLCLSSFFSFCFHP